METSTFYRDHIICYYQLTSLTTVEYFGTVLERFVGYGYLEGERLAKEYVDKLMEEETVEA